jgi:hypothetical protein
MEQQQMPANGRLDLIRHLKGYLCHDLVYFYNYIEHKHNLVCQILNFSVDVCCIYSNHYGLKV